MQNPKEFYTNQIVLHQNKAKQLFKTLSILSVLRLAVFVLTAAGVYFSITNWQLTAVIAVVGVASFLLLLSKYTDFKAERERFKRLIKINEDELEIVSGNFHDKPDGSEFQNPNHFYSLDIDLFGKGSFFQFINRTTLKEGKQKLANYLLENDTLDIPYRQNAIKEISTKAQWYQNYSAIGQGIEVEYSADKIIDWVKNYKPKLTKAWFIFTLVFSVMSLGVLSLATLKVIPLGVIGYWLLLGLALTAKFLKHTNNVSQHTSKARATFRQYALLLNQIETTAFKSQFLLKQQDKIKLKDKKASQIFSQFSRHIDTLDNRNNLISAIFGNGFFLSDIRQTYFIEKWLKTYADKIEDWFEVVTFFDAYNSLGNYAFNHQQFIFPKIVDKDCTISAKQLGHPLLNQNKRVDSDLELNICDFFIVTGANMAGKSTFLRTAALQIVMANVGLPVCAKQSRYKPIKLITSMRTTDSLTEDSSYFFSELIRLKFIVDTITKDNNYFIILDEILKGTNSTDKAIGSRKFVEKLVNLKATGIIATHDLSLTEIEKELEAVKNYYFDAEIVNDELFFDYKLKQGVCKNMNASFLLKKMEIV